LSRLAPNVTVVTSTTTASTAPKTAERTGVASRPLPGSRAKRRPVTADIGSPEVAAELTQRGSRFHVSEDRSDVTRLTSRLERITASETQDDNQREETEPEHCPVEGNPWIRVHRAYGSQQSERRQAYRHGNCQQ
jgi:hypothetical protein